MANKLAGLHPELIDAVNQILAGMAAFGSPMIVTGGLRTVRQQQKLYAQGRTAPGNIVTHADGLIKPSNHQAGDDGLGRAADCAFKVGRKVSWDLEHPWEVYGAMALHLGLEWGGIWKRFRDRPHVQLP